MGQKEFGAGEVANRDQADIAETQRNVYPLSVERFSPVCRRHYQSVKFNTWSEDSMRVNGNFGKVVMLATALLLLSFTLGFAKPHNEYKFKVFNNTSLVIKKIQEVIVIRKHCPSFQVPTEIAGDFQQAPMQDFQPC